MKEKFQNFPQALQKQILLRLGAGALSLLAFTVIAILYRDFYLCVSFLLFAIVFGAVGILLYLQIDRGDYVIVTGICQQVERTTLKRRAKTVYFSMEPHTIKVRLRHRIKDINTGDGITVYVSEKMPVYEEDGCELLNSYWAIEIKKGARSHE